LALWPTFQIWTSTKFRFDILVCLFTEVPERLTIPYRVKDSATGPMQAWPDQHTSADAKPSRHSAASRLSRWRDSLSLATLQIPANLPQQASPDQPPLSMQSPLDIRPLRVSPAGRDSLSLATLQFLDLNPKTSSVEPRLRQINPHRIEDSALGRFAYSGRFAPLV
jgi:hypothetical protein